MPAIQSPSLLLATVLLAATAAPTLARAQTPATTTTTTTSTATPGAAATARTPSRRAPRARANSPAAVPFDPTTGSNAPMGSLPPRLTPGRPAGAISTTPAVTPAAAGDAGESQTSPFTPR